MNVGEVRIAEDKDFENLKSHLISDQDDWSLAYEKKDTKVWTKAPPEDPVTRARPPPEEESNRNPAQNRPGQTLNAPDDRSSAGLRRPRPRPHEMHAYTPPDETQPPMRPQTRDSPITPGCPPERHPRVRGHREWNGTLRRWSFSFERYPRTSIWPFTLYISK